MVKRGSFFVLFGLLIISLFLFGCGKNPVAQSNNDTTVTNPGNPDQITIKPDQDQSINISVSQKLKNQQKESFFKSMEEIRKASSTEKANELFAQFNTSKNKIKSLSLPKAGISAQTVRSYAAPAGINIYVTTSKDNVDPTDGKTSLREAIIAANNTANHDIIRFKIDKSEAISNTYWSIKINYTQSGKVIPLPTIVQPVTIDGTPVSSAYDLNPSGHEIEINGASIVSSKSTYPLVGGLNVASSDVNIYDLVINNFSSYGAGILVNEPVNGLVIKNNLIGTDYTGSGQQSNYTGISIAARNTSNITIDDNTISGNSHIGVEVDFQLLQGVPNNLVIKNNNIGTTKDGSSSLGNGEHGVIIKHANKTNIENNIIAGTSGLTSGCSISIGSGLTLEECWDIAIERNKIGGGNNFGNARNGLSTYRCGDLTILDNTVSGNGFDGIALYESAFAWVHSNKVGTDDSGNNAVGNGLSGLALVRNFGVDIGNNILSGNAASSTSSFFHAGGLVDSSIFVNLWGNKIGTDASGQSAIPNKWHGLRITYSSYVWVGGPTQNGKMGPQGNLMSGNGLCGLITYRSENLWIRGNFIGTNSDGNTAIQNKGNEAVCFNESSDILMGVWVDPVYFDPADWNMVSGNKEKGIILTDSSKIHIIGNYIGTNPNGDSSIGNGQVKSNGASFSGVAITTHSPSSAAGSAKNFVNWNTIAHNDGAGIVVAGPKSIENSLAFNRFSENANSSILLYLNANNNQTAPTVKSAVYSPATNSTLIKGEVKAGSKVHAYKSRTPKYWITEGEKMLGIAKITKKGTTTDEWELQVNGVLSTKDEVSAISIDTNNNTSEFATGVTVQ